MMSEFKATICLTDIPRSLVRIGIDGKEYIDLYIGKKRHSTPFTGTHYVKIDAPKSKSYDTVFIGSANERTVV